jgi:hypothetical protein
MPNHTYRFSDSPDPVEINSVLHYTLDVELNQYAPSPATGVEVEMTLPNGVELKLVEPTAGQCDSSQLPKIRCTLPDMNLEGLSHIAIEVDVEIKDAGLLLLTSEATVTANEYQAHKHRERTAIPIPADIQVDLSIVVDVTDSMQQEIDGITQALKDYIAEIDEETVPLMALVTFKDEVKVAAFTYDLNVLLKAVENLEAQGGGTCPEASVEALTIAIPHTKDTGDILFVTDASPYPDADVNRVVEMLRNKGVRFHAMILGDCTLDESWNKLPNE